MSRTNQNTHHVVERSPASSLDLGPAHTRSVAGLSAIEADMFIWLTGAGKRAGR